MRHVSMLDTGPERLQFSPSGRPADGDFGVEVYPRGRGPDPAAEVAPSDRISAIVRRFVLLAVPLLLLLMAAFAFGVDVLGLDPDTRALATRGLLRSESMPWSWAAGAWLLEATALTALFLLVQGRGGSALLDGLVTGAIAWIFRGPVQVVDLALTTRLPREPWWTAALEHLVLYLLCGLLLAAVAAASGVRR